MITIIDYGMCNLNSVEKALELAISNKNLNKEIKITSDKNIIENSDAIILPGVGAFGAAMKNIEKLGLADLIKKISLIDKKPFLGICLGYQLLFDKSYEDGEFKGLGILKGEVKKFESKQNLKIPHMGWNNVDFGSLGDVGDLGGDLRDNHCCPLQRSVQDNSYFYFVHSYYVEVGKNFEGNIFWTDYGIKFAAGIQYENIIGLQFHPEKSQDNGIKILENWCDIIKQGNSYENNTGN
jgi:glutamine amidotransferase